MIAGIVRPLSLIAGGTVGVYLLAGSLADGASLADLPARLGRILPPDGDVLDGLQATLRVGLAALVVGIGVGLALVVVLSNRRGRAVDGPVAVLIAGAVTGLAVPGLAWLPVEAAVDADDGSLATTARLAGVVGLAVVPPVVTAAGPRRPDWAGWGRPWRIGLPATAATLALAGAEIVSGTGGLFDRLATALADGDPDRVLALALPVLVAGALIAVVAEVGRSLADRRPIPGPATGAPAPDGSRLVAVAASALAVGVMAVAVVGQVGEPAPADEVALLGPRLGGPWLGTDGDGASLAPLAARALGSTLVGSVVAAIAATVVGAVLAAIKPGRNRRLVTLATSLLDLARWPLAIVVPLAAAAVVPTTRPELHPVVLMVTTVALVPAAARLLVGGRAGRSFDLRRLAATAAVSTSLALAAHLLAGFVVPAGTGATPGLGELIAIGTVDYDRSPWPTLAPLIMAWAAMTALMWLVAALTSTTRLVPVSVTQTTGASGANRGILEGDGAGGRAAERPEPAITLLDDDGRAVPPTNEQPVTAGSGRSRSPSSAPPGNAASDVDEPEIDLVDEATRTVELRPSELRRAGVVPPEEERPI